MPWIHSISNHLYWSAQTCGGNADLLREKWKSIVHHITNVHQWNGELMTECNHGDLTDSDTDWLTVDSEAHKALKSVVLDKRLMKDIGQLSDFLHTGSLEVYHSLLLKYAPKRLHFQYAGMQTRLQLAALDHNHNVDRGLLKDSAGNIKVRQVFSKARKQWILRNSYENKQYTFLDDILLKIHERRMDTSVTLTNAESCLELPLTLKQPLATTAKPSLEEAKAKRYNRMSTSET